MGLEPGWQEGGEEKQAASALGLKTNQQNLRDWMWRMRGGEDKEEP